MAVDLSLRRALLAMGAAVFVMGACGSGDDPDRPGGAIPPAATHLRIEVRASANADPDVATLDCPAEPSSTGFIADPERACRAVQDNRELLVNGPPDNVACTEIYGGPQRAEISGEVGGQPVHLGVSREDGCAIATWDALEPLLGER